MVHFHIRAKKLTHAPDLSLVHSISLDITVERF